MTTNINLLPAEYIPKTSSIKLVSKLKSILMIGYGLFTLFLAGMIGYIFLLRSDVEKINAKNSNLSVQVESLEGTEQRLVLVRDRLVKAQDIYSTENIYQKLDAYDKFRSLILGLVEISDVKINKSDTKITTKSTNSSNMAEFLSKLAASNLYTSARMTDFNFTPTAGFFITVQITN